MSDRSKWKPLSPAFTAAVRKYRHVSKVRLLSAQRREAITAPLFHYTDRGGLKGILTTQKMWFTHYRHLNDDAEISFGIAAAQAVLADFAGRHLKAKIFCELTADLLTAENLDSAFGF